MSPLSNDVYCDALRVCGVKNCDLVLVQSDLRRIGPVESATGRQDYLNFYIKGLMDVAGTDVTIATATGNGNYARYSEPFIIEKTPSELGVLSEHIRKMKDAVRSIHPLVSVAAVGPRAQELCGGDHYNGFGYASPWGRLHRNDALIVTLGLGCADGGLTFLHYIENLYGVPYQYTKVYDVPVYKDNVAIDGVFTLSVRYLKFSIEESVSQFKSDLLEAGIARMQPLGNAWIWTCRARLMVEFAFSKLEKNRYYFLAHEPRFVKGEIPFDGPTAGRT